MSKAEVYAQMFEKATNATLAAAEKVPEDKRLKQIQEGKVHPLWLVGHLANISNLLVNVWCCDQESLLPKEYRKPFAPAFVGGDPVVPDPAKYPPWEEVLGVYRKVGEAIVSGLRSLSEDAIEGELRGGIPEDMKAQLGNVEATLMSMISHDSYHRGQLGMLAALE